jgi:hypothetical protein
LGQKGFVVVVVVVVTTDYHHLYFLAPSLLHQNPPEYGFFKKKIKQAHSHLARR